jgi:hypothetical protein
MFRLSVCVSIGPKFKSNHKDYFKKCPIKAVAGLRPALASETMFAD